MKFKFLNIFSIFLFFSSLMHTNIVQFSPSCIQRYGHSGASGSSISCCIPVLHFGHSCLFILRTSILPSRAVRSEFLYTIKLLSDNLNYVVKIQQFILSNKLLPDIYFFCNSYIQIIKQHLCFFAVIPDNVINNCRNS